jgi:hypothetical protein
MVIMSDVIVNLYSIKKSCSYNDLYQYYLNPKAKKENMWVYGHLTDSMFHPPNVSLQRGRIMC